MKSKINLFIIIVLLMFGASISSAITFIAMFCVIVVAIYIGANSKNDANICYGIILLLCMQNFCIGMGAHLFGNNDGTLKYITQFPFLTVLSIWLTFQMRKIKSKKLSYSKDFKWFILYVICILVSLVIQRGDIKSILTNVRNMTIFYMIYEIGKETIKTKEQLDFFL